MPASIFLTLVVHSHVLYVAMDLLKMYKLSGTGIKNKTTTEKEKFYLILQSRLSPQ